MLVCEQMTYIDEQMAYVLDLSAENGRQWVFILWVKQIFAGNYPVDDFVLKGP